MAGFISNSERDSLLAGMLGSAPWNGTVNCRLFQNNVVVDASTVLADLTEANYPSYAPVALGAWSAPSGGSGGYSSSTNDGAVFAPGVTGSPQDCYGWYLTDGSGNLIGCGNFGGGPRNMGGTITSLTVIPTLTLA